MSDGNRFAKLLSRLRKSRPQPRAVDLSPNTSTVRGLLEGRTVLVTGGANNVGKAIANESAKEGADVVIVDIDDRARASTERELSQYPGQVKSYCCDMSRVAEIDVLCDALRKDGIQVDVLVNNVGLTNKIRPVVDLDVDDWQETFAVNVFGPMHLTRSIARSMINEGQQGSILFITSIHQWVVRRNAAYSASKCALGMIVKELAVDLAPHRIRVNGIAPGWVAEDAAAQPLPQRVALLHQTSIPPCYIGRAVVYLSADYYSFHTTGSVLKIDAGLSLNDYLVKR